MRRVALVVTLAGVLLGMTRPVAAQFPIFDAHIHYSRPDWSVYTPERALSILAQAGVHRAIVSSTPDDGTVMLYEKAPAGIVPFLRPYRTRDDMGSWTRDAAVAAYVEERLKRGIYRGIGFTLLARFGTPVAIAATATAFGLAHGLLGGFVQIALLGCALAWLRSRVDSVVPGMFIHGTFNLISVVASVTIGG